MLHQSLANPTWPLSIFAGEATGIAAGAHPTEAASEETNWEPVATGVDCRALVEGPELTMAQVRFRRGATLAGHAHRGGQGGYVLQGKLLITLAAEQLTVAAGQGSYLPAGATHQIRAVEKSVVIEMHAPGAAVSTAAATLVGGASERAPLPVRPGPRPGPASRWGRTGGRVTRCSRTATRSSRCPVAEPMPLDATAKYDVLAGRTP